MCIQCGAAEKREGGIDVCKCVCLSRGAGKDGILYVQEGHTRS